MQPCFIPFCCYYKNKFKYLIQFQVSSDLKPVVGLRLYLEGKKCNWLALHVQHLSSLPNIMTFASGRPCQWRGSDDYKSSDQFLEPVRWKRYSNVCTSVVKHDPNWLQEVSSGVFIVTGAQLLSKGKCGQRQFCISVCFTPIYPTAQSGRQSGQLHLKLLVRPVSSQI